MTTRRPQLDLRLDSAPPNPAARWHDGALLIYLGRSVVLRLSTGASVAFLEENMLHLPLPPQASPRQIQDSAEAWLRREATRIIAAGVAREAQHRGLTNARWALSFGLRRGGFELHRDGSLRFNWRMIEQPTEVIDDVIARAIAVLPPPADSIDLWDYSPA
jgi:predicted metal-dependent hydrolase